MRCERCKFENIPGQKTCIKCGSILELTSEQVNIYPPRMPIWKRPIRYLLRLMRKGKVIPGKEIKFHCPSWITQCFDDSILGLFLSVIPGLAHIIQKRFKEIRWYFLTWVALLISGLFLYGSRAGFICLGLAIGVHTGIAVQYKILKEAEDVGRKIGIIIIVLIVLAIIYRYSPRILIPNLTGVYSSMSIPQKIEKGDYLLAWRNSKQKTSLKRGDLVLIHPVIIGHNVREVIKSKEQTVGQIIGLAGEQLDIKNGVFTVNGQQLDSNMYPVPQWLQVNNFSVIIPDNSYFISVQYSVMAHNMALEAEYINRVCIIKADDIESQVFMRWWPLTRRGFIR